MKSFFHRYWRRAITATFANDYYSDGKLRDTYAIMISVSTATLVTLCIGAAFLLCAVAMTWWLCRRRREHTKLNSDKSLAFKPPHRKPTAVKSPGSTSHYLKKSPSPTGPAKSPPGSGGQTPSPTGSQSSNPTSQPRTPQGAGNPIRMNRSMPQHVQHHPRPVAETSFLYIFFLEKKKIVCMSLQIYSFDF